MEWHLQQQPVTAHRKRGWDQVQYEDKAMCIGGFAEDEVDSFIPWSRFKQIGLAEGKTLTTLQQDWDELIRNPSSGAIRARDQWLVPIFEGVRRMKHKAWLREHTAKKWKDIQNVESFLEAKRASDQSLKNFLHASVSSKQEELADAPLLENPGMVLTLHPHPPETFYLIT